MRKTIQRLALVALTMLSTAMASAVDFTVGNFKYTVLDADAKTVAMEAVDKAAVTGTLVIPATVTDGTDTYTVAGIAANAFSYCTMTEVEFATRTAPLTIGSYAFNNCQSITSVVLPDQVNEMGDCVFQHCEQLTSVHFSTSMTKVPYHTFDCCYALASISGLDNVTRLEMAAFGNCRGFTSFTIPANMEYIGEVAFGDLQNVESYTFAGNKVKEIGNNAFQNNVKLTSFTMPNSVETMGTEAFINTPMLTDVTISNQITSLPNGTFNGSGLTAWTIPANITEIGSGAFNNTKLVSIEIPVGVRINPYAFQNCSKLERVYFDDPSFAYIPEGAFLGCPMLNYIRLAATTPPGIGWYGFDNPRSKIFADVPESAIDTYKADSEWRDFKYDFSLNATGATDLTADHAALSEWTSKSDTGFNYFENYNIVEQNSLIWTFTNPVAKAYTILLEASNLGSNDASNKLEIKLIKMESDGTSEIVCQEAPVASGYSFASLEYFRQVYVSIPETLPTGKYQLKIKNLGPNGKYVKDVQIVPTADLLTIETAMSPVGTGIITYTGKLAQAKDNTSEVTLTAEALRTPGVSESWITFKNWTVDGAVVSTDASYTFTPSASTKVVANFTPEFQTIPTPEGDEFNVTHAVVRGDNDTKWYMNEGGNFGWIKNGYNFTYYVSNQKPALYNFKFMTGTGNEQANDGRLTATIEVFDAEGNTIITKVQTIHPQATLSWRCTDDYTIAFDKPLMPGDYSVRVTFNHPTCLTDMCNFGEVSFELVAIVPETITLSKTASSVMVGFEETLTATLATSTGDAITSGYDTVAWTSSNTAVATVDAAGKVTAVAPGTATITAQATGRTDIDLTASCALTVPQHVTDITVASTLEMYNGDVVEITATVTPETAANKTLTWASSDTETVEVDATGKLTAKKPGTATITVTAADRGMLSKNITVTVKQQVTAITLNETAATLTKTSTLQLTASYTPDNATLKQVTWASSDESIATVSTTGLVTAVAGGVATITATAADGRGATAECEITVNVPVESITLDQTSATVYKDVQVQLTATVNPDDATVKTVTWTSSNAAIASVTDAGLVTAVSAGDATITVRSTANSAISATFTIHVMSVSAAGTGANQLLFHEVVNNSEFGDNCIAWDNTTSRNWVANSIVLTDAQSYTNPYNVTVSELTYNRTFATANWAPLFVPFAMDFADWDGKASVAELAGVHMYDDGRATVIEFITVKSGGSTRPNVPYVIMPDMAGDLTITCNDVTLTASPTEGANYISCGTPRWTYKFFGNYQPIAATALNAIPGETTPYIMTGEGKFAHAAASATLSPFRFYIVKSRSDNGYWGAPAREAENDDILIMIDGTIIDSSSMTGVFEVIVEGDDGIYYDLNGRQVQHPHNGIFIHNGQKILIK